MRRLLLVPLLMGLLALVPAGPAAAAHPCAQGSDGRVSDPSTSSDHDGCGDYGSPAVTLTQASDGATVTVAVGQTVAVRLGSTVDMAWSGVTAPPTGALFALRAAVDDSAATAVFRAERASSGERLSATTDHPCAHAAQPCARPQRLWSATVVVTGGSPSDRTLRCRSLPAADSTATVVVGDSADGTTVRLPVGGRLQVRLGTCPDGGGYRVPEATSELYRSRVALQQAGSSVATFSAVRAGTATVTTTIDLPCLHREPGCATTAQVWALTVEVVPAQQPVDEGCRPHTVALDRTAIGIGEAVVVTLRSPATSTVFTLNATTPDRRGFLGGRSESPGEDETITWTLRPTENTRMEVRHGHLCGVDDLGVVTVTPRVSIAARRNAPRDYTFSGRVLPGRGQSVALFRVEPDGRQVLTARTTVGADGLWRVDRRFTGSGRFGFVAVVAPGRTAGAQSAVRPTVVH